MRDRGNPGYSTRSHRLKEFRDRFVGYVGSQGVFFAAGNGISAVLISAGLCLYAFLAGWPMPSIWIIPLSGASMFAATLLTAVVVKFLLG